MSNLGVARAMRWRTRRPGRVLPPATPPRPAGAAAEAGAPAWEATCGGLRAKLRNWFRGECVPDAGRTSSRRSDWKLRIDRHRSIVGVRSEFVDVPGPCAEATFHVSLQTADRDGANRIRPSPHQAPATRPRECPRSDTSPVVRVLVEQDAVVARRDVGEIQPEVRHLMAFRPKSRNTRGSCKAPFEMARE